MDDDLFNLATQVPRLVAQRAAAASPPPLPSVSSASASASAAPTLPHPSAIRAAEASLPDPSSAAYLQGRPAGATAAHIARDIAPALTGQALSSRYYGFVTGGVLPLAEWADNVVSRLDQNVQVHLPAQTVATAVEDAALEMLARLLRLPAAGFPGRTFTTGATGSNVLGLACGREAVVDWGAEKRKTAAGGGGAGAGAGEEEEEEGGGRGDHGSSTSTSTSTSTSVAELGLLRACLAAGIADIQVLTSGAHSSLSKAASVVGLGRRAVRELAGSADEPWRLRLDDVERELRRPGVASIVAVSAGDVNTGAFALDGRHEWERLRALADQHGAWIHVDAAMGAFAAALPDEPRFQALRRKTDGMELADSIALDAHKLLNVPYDCGVFFTRSASTLTSVFRNPNAAYLAPGGSGAAPSNARDIQSPLNIGLENSRRFRALPVYAVLLSEGRPGMAQMLANMVLLARRIAAFLHRSPHYELLLPQSNGETMDDIFMIVLFRAVDRASNHSLVDRINQTREMYVSGTTWKGEKAVRIAVASWRVHVDRDFAVVAAILDAVAKNPEPVT